MAAIWISCARKWATGSGECWQAGTYQPRQRGRAVEIVLHDWEYAAGSAVAVTAPYIEMICDQKAPGDTVPILYSSKNASAPDAHRVTLPYPRNGVVFAEGNVGGEREPAGVGRLWLQRCCIIGCESQPASIAKRKR